MARIIRNLRTFARKEVDAATDVALDAVVNEVGLQRPVAIGVDIRNRDFAVGPVLEQLDRLAAEGVHFDQASTPVPITLPALNMAWRCEACGMMMLDLSKMIRRR